MITKFISKFEDSYGEKNFEFVKGEFYFNDSDGNIKLNFESKLGYYEITCFDSNILISRTGENSNLMKINFENKLEKFLYLASNISQEFFIRGLNFNIDIENKSLTYSYELLDLEYNVVNKINFSIKKV